MGHAEHGPSCHGPAGELICEDRDLYPPLPVVPNPRYRMAGSWPTACETCGSLVDPALQQQHTKWHTQINGGD